MQFLPDVALKPYNTLALAANAQALTTVSSADEIPDALAWARSRGLSVLPLGAGSNIVLAADVDALVLLQAPAGVEMLSQDENTVSLRVTAGENWHDFVAWTLQQGYFGLENLALIPGTVGAAPIQNIGAYGVELSASLQHVHCLGVANGKRLVLSTDECAFAYRNSIFKQALRDEVIITAVDLQLSRVPQVNVTYPALSQALAERVSETLRGDLASATPQQVFDTVVQLRRSKLPDPAVEPNAGSFFKNPVVDAAVADSLVAKFPGLPAYPQNAACTKLPAAWLIEHCGFKGTRKNNHGVHPQHALVLVNYGNDSGSHLLAMAGDIATAVNNTFGIQLEIEPRVYGGPA